MGTAATSLFSVWNMQNTATFTKSTALKSTPIVPVWEIDLVMSKPAAVGFTLTFMDEPITLGYVPLPTGNTTATNLIDASGGLDGLSTVLPYLCGLSLDGGTNYDVYFMLTQPVHNVTFSDTTTSIFTGYSKTGIDRVTFHGVTFYDVLSGLEGTITANGVAGPDSFLSSVFLPFQKGLFETIPGLSSWAGQNKLKYQVFTDSHLVDILVNADTEADYIDKALNVYLNQVAGVVVDGDDAPIGSRGQWVEDSSDPALNQQFGSSPTLVVGSLGESPYVHFRMKQGIDPVQPPLDTAYILEQADSKTYMDISGNVKDVLAKISYVGGQTNHGLPDGGSILSPVIVYPSSGPTSTSWTDNLCLFVSADSSGFGGVYYWPHDGAAYNVGGSLVNPKWLVYDQADNMLYVSTDIGVYGRTADVTSNDDWALVGNGAGQGLIYKCNKLIFDPFLGNLIVEVKGSGTADGIYVHPAISGDTSGDPIGYPGWSVLTIGSFNDWSYTGYGDELVYCDSNSPSMVSRMIYAGSAGNSTTVWVPTPTTSPVKSLNPLVYSYQTVDPITNNEITITERGTAVCTTEGSLGIYYLDPRGQFHPLNLDGSLTDPYGYPVGVNYIINFQGDVVVGNRTIQPKLFALTDSGVYFTENAYGGGWQGLQAQSGIQDQSITWLAVGQVQTVVKRQLTRMYATNGKSLYCSHTGGIYWDDEVSEPVTIGAFLTSLYSTLFGATANKPLPNIHMDNTITSLGTVPGGIDPNSALGTSGKNIPGPFPAPYNLKGDLVWVRPLDEHSRWTYRLVHSASQAPYTPIEFGEVTEILTDSATNHAVASGRLAQAMVRYLGDRSRLQVMITVRSSFADSSHNLRKLRPAMMVDLTYKPKGPYYTNFSGTKFYVISHKLYKPDGYTVVYTETVLSSVARTTQITMDEIASGIIYTNSKIIRKAGRVSR